ncbi:hypothetical protein NM208_g2348 [Fusarium decemcellulare]|uniref:Uncharacterized protein n=1 Tax=Fusarium decemcellulare TaxID=57161 RepID=A0ACC1ST73_9HYPO|nr:hypothetical protein NM208_g2348 [Fusarium decemcellulare]
MAMAHGFVEPQKGSFIIVGCGYGGLGAAIELPRKGFDVEVFEAAKHLTTQGDVIHLSPNGTRVLAKWGTVLDETKRQAASISKAVYHDREGNKLLESELTMGDSGFPELYCNRGEVQRVMYEHGKSLGIKFHFGTRITSYYEDDTNAGVYVGETLYKAHGVIAADGIHSVARTVTTGQEDRPVGSGFAVYRTWFPLDCLKDDPLTSHYVTSGENCFHVWLDRDIHAMVVTNQSLRGCVVFCTHKDTAESHESWSSPGKVEDELSLLEGWDETLRAVVSKIPPGRLVDWKLLWRDQARKWVSEKGRIVLLGDSAHPHLPTSGTGAVMAFEDAATIAAVIDDLACTRRERTSLTMRLGWETRHRWHRTDVKEIATNAEVLKMPQPKWLTAHDAEKYAYEKIKEATRSLQENVPFMSTNTYEGYIHEDWTIETMLELTEKGEGFEYLIQEGDNLDQKL